MSDFICPHCGNEQDNDGDSIDHEETVQVDCRKCGKEFLVTGYLHMDYDCEDPEDAASEENLLRDYHAGKITANEYARGGRS